MTRYPTGYNSRVPDHGIAREERDGVAVLRLEHGKAHALDVELCAALAGELDTIGASDALGVVLTGTGPIFSAGVDLFRAVEGGPGYIERFLPVLADAFTKLFAFPRPVVAAVNGHAIAGGCVLTCACDYRIMARGPGTIGVPELKVGVPFPYIAIEILRFATPNERLQELLYLGRTFGVDEALAHGLIDEVASPDTLLDRACDVARQLGSGHRARFELTKRQVRQPSLERIARHDGATAEAVSHAWKDPAALEAIRRYLAETLKKGA